ncbi:MAG: Ig-like domain-containing protein [Chitinophagaceae bacterium]
MILFSLAIDYKGFPEWSLNKKDSTEYALYTPSNLQPGSKYPIALFMHGCCGVDNHVSLRNAVDPPVRMWHQFGADKQDIPTYIIAPATLRGWAQHFKSLKEVMDDLVANHQGDPQRIYVCGFSMGGEGTFRIIQQYPDYFAAAITMGMTFRGDSLKVKDLPIWANQGETDNFSRGLRKQVAAIRVLNGLTADTGSTWIEGVNPRYSNFKGVGHGVQWDAASTQDLTGWAYSKINNGNKYPIVFFENSDYPIHAEAGKPVVLNITASDPDGSVNKVEMYSNHVLRTTLNKAPYQFTLTPVRGDNIIEAIAYDNNGKKTNASTIIIVNMKPVLSSKTLPVANAGDYYQTRLPATGNGPITFSVKDKSTVPKGLDLYPDGTLEGLTNQEGVFKINIIATDDDNESIHAVFAITVKGKKKGDVLISKLTTSEGKEYKLSKVSIGQVPNFNSKDSLLSSNPNEITFSNVGGYEGLTYIQTDVNDANKSTENFLSFENDEDVVVYVAYEKLDKIVTSTVPAWLKAFKKEEGQIVAQYRYFDVYSRAYKKGNVMLPGADAAKNSVGLNYFVMIKKK